MKRFVLAAVFVLFLLIFYTALTQKAAADKEINPKTECIKCHTDAKKLIRLSWKIEKIKPKPGKSKEISGDA